MTFLPEEFACTQEQTSTHLPSHHVAPLVAEYRQIAIRLDPVLISIPYNSFRCRTYDKFLLKLSCRVHHYTIVSLIGFKTVMRNYGAFLGEAFNMLCLTAEERFRNQQREISILHSCFLELVIKYTLHLFPDSITVRLDNHTSSHISLLCQISLHNKFVVPL